MNDQQFIYLFSGILCLQICIKYLKHIIKQKRPIATKTYGMPSSRSAVMTFILTYLIMIHKFPNQTIIIVSLIVSSSLYMKYRLQEHSMNQLLCGSILGILFGFLIWKLQRL
jgi:membrane-associated phospholipid phosphatase